MKYALLFPGQGSQSLEMLAALGNPLVQQTYQEASDALGWDMGKLIAQGPVEALNRTERTQPALLAASIALWKIWQQNGVPLPGVLAGHSLGEYSALVAAESLEFADALKLVELRGQLMQAAVPEGTGGMAAVIGLDDAAVEKLCASCSEGLLEAVNYNAPGQVVVAGESAALEWLAANGKAAGARMVMRLPVSVPSHCSLMKGAAEKLAERLSSIRVLAPKIEILHNVDAAARSDAADIRSALQQQLYRPVRWTQTITKLSENGVGVLLECGPGKVLTGLTKRIVPQSKFLALEDLANHATALELVNN